MTAASPTGEDASCDRPSVSAAGTSTLVEAAMITRAKARPVSASAGAARRRFTNPRVLEAVLLEGPTFAGLLDRDALPQSLLDEAPLSPCARQDAPVIARDRPLSEAAELMQEHGMLRLPVVEADGATLAGLLCLNHERSEERRVG